MARPKNGLGGIVGADVGLANATSGAVAGACSCRNGSPMYWSKDGPGGIVGVSSCCLVDPRGLLMALVGSSDGFGWI